jgi:hypothetical protein
MDSNSISTSMNIIYNIGVGRNSTQFNIEELAAKAKAKFSHALIEITETLGIIYSTTDEDNKMHQTGILRD